MIETSQYGSRPAKNQEVDNGVPDVEFVSVLRIRPLKKKEEEDPIVLETVNGNIALLHPNIIMTSPEGKSRRSFESGSSMFIKEGEQIQFQFDNILDADATQDKVHYSMGLNMARDCINPLKSISNDVDEKSLKLRNHLVLSLGISDTGKTYTTFGSQKATGRTNGKHPEDGLVPRILESLFSQSQHHIRNDSNVSFAVRITMLHITTDQVQDMLAESTGSKPTPTKSSINKPGVMALTAKFEKKRSRDENVEVKIEQSAKTNDYVIDPNTHLCADVLEAREVLHYGLSRFSTGIIGGLVGKSKTRAHSLINMQPVLFKRDCTSKGTIIKKVGGTITVLDMAGIEAAKKGRNNSAAMREEIALNSSLSAVMHCLRTIKHNHDVLAGGSSTDTSCDDASADCSDISDVSETKQSVKLRNLKKVQYRQSKLTMLLQPIFSPTGSLNKEIASSARAMQQHPAMRTVVTIMHAAYPGSRDYSEKKSLLHSIQLLRGNNFDTKEEVKTSKKKHSRERMVSVKSGAEDVTNGNHGLKHDQSGKKHREAMLDSIAEVSAPTSDAPTDSSAWKDGIHDLSSMPPPFSPTYQPLAVNPASTPSHRVIGSGKKQSNATKTSPQLSANTGNLSMDATSSTPKLTRFPPIVASVTTRSKIKAPAQNTRSNTKPVSASKNKAEHNSRCSGHTSSIVPPASNPSFGLVGRVIQSPDLRLPPVAPSPGGTPMRVRAAVNLSPNIRPPCREIQSPSMDRVTIDHKPIVASPNAQWMGSGSMKAINKVVHASRKKGIKALGKVEKMVTHSFVSQEAPNEMSTNNKVSRDTLLRTTKLEHENSKLSERNILLEARCAVLQKDKEKLTKSLQDARRHNRRTDWNDRDEEEWQQSRRSVIREQTLIESPLQDHLDTVQVTNDINNTYLKTEKQHFDLVYPPHWKRATDLNKRDLKRHLESEAQALAAAERECSNEKCTGEAKKKLTY